MLNFNATHFFVAHRKSMQCIELLCSIQEFDVVHGIEFPLKDPFFQQEFDALHRVLVESIQELDEVHRVHE